MPRIKKAKTQVASYYADCHVCDYGLTDPETGSLAHEATYGERIITCPGCGETQKVKPPTTY